MAKIGLDVDGTLALVHESIVLEYNKESGGSYTSADFTSWAAPWKVPMTYNDFYRLYDLVWGREPCTIMPSVSQELIIELSKWHKVDLLTYRPQNQYACLHNWMVSHFPTVALDIVITKTLEEKIHRGYDVLFDDGNPVAQEMTKTRKPNTTLFLIRRPWNINERYEHPNIVPAKSLDDGIKRFLRSEIGKGRKNPIVQKAF